MTTPRDSRPQLDEHALGELLAPHALLHARCGRPIADHPATFHVGGRCPFPALPPVEFRIAEAGPTVRVCGIPDPSNLPRPVLEVLGALAEVIRDHYAIGVEVEAEGEREAAVLALETIRRYLA